MPNYFITDYIFEKKTEKDIFYIKDKELKKIERKISKANNKLFKFINQRVHPRSRKRLKQLIEKNYSLMDEQFYRQCKLCYSNGFTDGIKLILSNLSH